MSILERLNSPNLIPHKIWVTEKNPKISTLCCNLPHLLIGKKWTVWNKTFWFLFEFGLGEPLCPCFGLEDGRGSGLSTADSQLRMRPWSMNLAFQNVLLRNYLTMKNTSRFGVIGEEVEEEAWLMCGRWKLWIKGACPPSEIKEIEIQRS